MDAIRLLTQQHREVEELFSRFERLEARSARLEVLNQILRALGMHTEIEESEFYPAFRMASKKDHEVFEALEEHHLVKLVCQELTEAELLDDRALAKVTVLKELVRHHVKEEEQEMFKEALELLGADTLRELGQKMQAAIPQSEQQAPKLRTSIAPGSQVEEAQVK